jgi:hypothetical protein
LTVTADPRLDRAAEALREAVIALREAREYVRHEAPHAPTQTELGRVQSVVEDALADVTGTPAPDRDPSDEQSGARPGIVAGRPDPYVFASHLTALNLARVADHAVGETSSYAIKHDPLWTLQLAAEQAARALWTAISDHSVHCHGCDKETPDA